MKAGEKPQFSAAWWLKNKAKTLSESELGPALAAYEKPFAKFLSNPAGESPSLKLASDALKKLPAAVAKTIDKCNSTLHKETIDCLKKFEPMIKLQLKNIGVELVRRTQVDALDLAALTTGAHKAAFVAFGTKRASGEMVAYLAVMRPSTKGDAAIFNKFIKEGAPMELNIDASTRSQFCKPGDRTRTVPRDDLDKGPWAAVYTEIAQLVQNNLVDQFKALLKGKAHSFAPLFA